MKKSDCEYLVAFSIHWMKLLKFMVDRYWMLQGVFRILIFESRQMKDVRLLDDT